MSSIALDKFGAPIALDRRLNAFPIAQRESLIRSAKLAAIALRKLKTNRCASVCRRNRE